MIYLALAIKCGCFSSRGNSINSKVCSDLLCAFPELDTREPWSTNKTDWYPGIQSPKLWGPPMLTCRSPDKRPDVKDTTVIRDGVPHPEHVFCVCTWEQVPEGKGLGSPGAGMTSSYAPPDVGAGTWTLVCCKCSMQSQPLSHYLSCLGSKNFNMAEYMCEKGSLVCKYVHVMEGVSEGDMHCIHMWWCECLCVYVEHVSTCVYVCSVLYVYVYICVVCYIYIYVVYTCTGICVQTWVLCAYMLCVYLCAVLLCVCVLYVHCVLCVYVCLYCVYKCPGRTPPLRCRSWTSLCPLQEQLLSLSSQFCSWMVQAHFPIAIWCLH